MGNLIMPKNIGDGDYMVALKIYYEAGDWISNDEFKSIIQIHYIISSMLGWFCAVVEL